MFWLEGKMVDIGSCRRALDFARQIVAFMSVYSDHNLIQFALNFWNMEKHIVLPFRASFKSIDITFLRGLANIASLDIVVASKKWSLPKRGYLLSGVSSAREGFRRVTSEPFSGFGSTGWHILRLGDDGFSIYIHAQGSFSVRRFIIEEVDGKLVLSNSLLLDIVNGSDILSDKGKIRQSLLNRSGIDRDVVEFFTDSLYDANQEVIKVRFDEVLRSRKIAI